MQTARSNNPVAHRPYRVLDRPVGLFTFVRLKRYLEEILESSVDLGTPDSLKPYLREPVLQEAIRACILLKADEAANKVFALCFVILVAAYLGC